MATAFKVRALEPIYYVDGIRKPGDKNRAGEPLDEFFLNKKEDFNPQVMEPLGWIPGEAFPEVKRKEDGTPFTTIEIASMDSDKLDEGIRKARAAKAEKEQAGFEVDLNKPKGPGVL